MDAAVAYAQEEGEQEEQEEQQEQQQESANGSMVEEADGYRLHIRSKNNTGYKGVIKDKGDSHGRFLAIRNSLRIGLYDTAVEAAVAYARHVEQQSQPQWEEGKATAAVHEGAGAAASNVPISQRKPKRATMMQLAPRREREPGCSRAAYVSPMTTARKPKPQDATAPVLANRAPVVVTPVRTEAHHPTYDTFKAALEAVKAEAAAERDVAIAAAVKAAKAEAAAERDAAIAAAVKAAKAEAAAERDAAIAAPPAAKAAKAEEAAEREAAIAAAVNAASCTTIAAAMKATKAEMDVMRDKMVADRDAAILAAVKAAKAEMAEGRNTAIAAADAQAGQKRKHTDESGAW